MLTRKQATRFDYIDSSANGPDYSDWRSVTDTTELTLARPASVALQPGRLNFLVIPAW